MRTCFWNDCWIYLWHFFPHLVGSVRSNRIPNVLLLIAEQQHRYETQQQKLNEKSKIHKYQLRKCVAKLPLLMDMTHPNRMEFTNDKRKINIWEILNKLNFYVGMQTMVPSFAHRIPWIFIAFIIRPAHSSAYLLDSPFSFASLFWCCCEKCSSDFCVWCWVWMFIEIQMEKYHSREYDDMLSKMFNITFVLSTLYQLFFCADELHIYFNNWQCMKTSEIKFIIENTVIFIRLIDGTKG